MNSKVLFSVLMGSALVASCSSDDELFSAPAAEVNDAPAFVVVNDDETRLDVQDHFRYVFQDGDLMSLYNGIAAGQYNNAIYSGNGTPEGFVFTTKSMVKEGTAIFVFPCDTTFAALQPNGLPYLSIAKNQGKNYIEKIPYMTEILDIPAYSATGAQSAGYGRNYKIQLKQVGSTLDLTIDPQNDAQIKSLEETAGIDPMKVTKMALTATKGGNDVFNVKVPVKVGASKNYGPGLIWSNVSGLDFTAATTATTLTTTNVTNDKATFVLLPVQDKPAKDADNKIVETAGKDDLIDAASLVISTNYGTITVDESTPKTWKLSSAANYTADPRTIAQGLNYVMLAAYDAKNDAASKFNGEEVGANFARTILADISKLDMNGLHIKNSKQLIDVLKVYDAVKANQAANVNFYLDGDNNKVFEMTPEAVDAFSAHCNLSGSKTVTFNLCTVSGEVCTKVKLNNPGAVKELPANMKFGNAAYVELVGAWQYTSKKTVGNVTDLVVSSSATLDVKGECGTNGSITNGLQNKGTINVTGIAYVADNEWINYKTVNIPANKELRVRSTFTNDATSLTNQGRVENAGVLAAVVSDNGVVNNYGTIKKIGDGSKSYVTNNQIGGDFGSAWSSTNKFGTIILNSKDDDNYSVSNDANQGFIKLEVHGSTVNGGALGTEANYIVVMEDVTTFNYGLAGSRLRYVEFNNASECVWNSASSSYWTAVIVNDEVKVNIKKDNKVNTNYACLSGTVYNGGIFNVTYTTTYFGSYPFNDHVIAY